MEFSQNTRRSRSGGPIYLPRVVEFNREKEISQLITGQVYYLCFITKRDYISDYLCIYRKIKKDCELSIFRTRSR